MLEEAKVLVAEQKRDLKVRQVAMAEAQAHDLYPHDGWDLLAELEGLHERMAGVKDECVAKAEEPVALVMGISKALVDLSLPPIQGVPQVLRKAREVLEATGIILKCL
jgi:hypothetical protein